MTDPREFSCTDDALENNGWGWNRDEEDLRLTFDEEPLDDENWWEDDDISWIGD